MTSKEVVTTPSVIDVFGKNLKFYRKKKQLTIADLANKLNIGKSTISSWENGKHSPDIEIKIKIKIYESLMDLIV